VTQMTLILASEQKEGVAGSRGMSFGHTLRKKGYNHSRVHSGCTLLLGMEFAFHFL
jgi:hypothetical protein